MQKRVLVTGACGFIGYHLSKRLLAEGCVVLGIDNFNSYYDPKLKRDRFDLLKTNARFQFREMDLNAPSLSQEFTEFRPQIVIHLAAQAGVRYSIENPWAYIDSNLIAFQRVIEALRIQPVEHFIFASSSSVYGGNTKTPFSVTDRVDSPVSLYAATKRSNELIAHVYSKQFRIPTTGLRFFTVYGSYGRPDMAYYSFTRKILRGEKIPLFNNGDLKRDFTHIEDIIESLVRVTKKIPEGDTPYRLMNIGASRPVNLMEFVTILEDLLGKKAIKEMKPMQMGDVYQTHADVDDLEKLIDYRPKISLREGLNEFVAWFEKEDVLNRYSFDCPYLGPAR